MKGMKRREDRRKDALRLGAKHRDSVRLGEVLEQEPVFEAHRDSQVDYTVHALKQTKDFT